MLETNFQQRYKKFRIMKRILVQLNKKYTPLSWEVVKEAMSIPNILTQQTKDNVWVKKKTWFVNT